MDIEELKTTELSPAAMVIDRPAGDDNSEHARKVSVRKVTKRVKSPSPKKSKMLTARSPDKENF